ncbi:MAG TPA: L-histidine N(alpha)-methyltransferase [Rhizomicrobium sp.]|nr:L-histidine N(alpha)-methyltransferase [Rhizomicrobium sp.]
MDARRAEAIDAGFDDSFARHLSEGLHRNPKEIACKYFYDTEGSALFDAICALPEYYQTRTEVALLRRHVAEIAGLIGHEAEIVEFGAGSLRKIRILLDALEAPCAYTPIDISGAYLCTVARNLAAEYPRLHLRPMVGDFTLPLHIAPLPENPRRAGFFPGGTIGNFRTDAAMALLRRMREMLNGGGLLVGVDLVKDPALLHAAYNDAAGVTAAFNKNLLARANRELGAGFDLGAFAHYAPYNLAAQRIEMYLVSLKRQSVALPGGTVEFFAGEAVHTEDSHKYSIESFREIAVRAGFSPRAVWTDENRLFALHWLESR